MKKIAFVCCLLVFVFLACSRDKPIKQTINAEAMRYIGLRLGQYFIYKDSASGDMDSVVVTESKVITEEYTEWGWLGDVTVLRLKFYLTLTKENGIPTPWLSGWGYVGSYPVSIGSPTFFAYPWVTTTMTVEGITYPDVIVTTNELGSIYCWAAGVGLIKSTWYYSTQAPPTNTFTLVRHN